MRAKFLLVGTVSLLIAACTAKVNHAPPTFDHQLLIGKWKNVAEAQIIAGYEFGQDGALKMTVHGMEQPVKGRYSWSGERTLELEYDLTPDVEKAYRAAAKAYKDDITDRVKSKKLSDRAAPAMLASARDELPAKQTFRASINEKPRMLVLIDDKDTTSNFEKAD